MLFDLDSEGNITNINKLVDSEEYEVVSEADSYRLYDGDPFLVIYYNKYEGGWWYYANEIVRYRDKDMDPDEYDTSEYIHEIHISERGELNPQPVNITKKMLEW